MASNTIFMAVPLGTATNYKWQGLFRDLGEPGYKVFWAAAALADMAAEGGSGGRLLNGQGEPLSALQICTRLGVEATWAEKIMFPALIFLGEGQWGEDGGWNCTSPMISKTLEWQNSTTKALPGPVEPQKGGRKSMFSRTLTEAEYKAWQRNCVLPDGVFLQKTCPKKAKGSCPEKSGNCPLLSGNVRKLSGNCPETKEDNFRTDDVEDAEIVDEKKCPETPNIKEVKGNKKKTTETKPDTPVVVSSSAALNPSNPTPQTPALSPAIQQAVEALPQEYQKHALQICQESTQAEEILLDSLFYFSAKIAKGKADGCGYLVDSIKKGWGKGCRKLAQEAEEKSEATRRRRQLVEAAQEEKKEAEKRKQVELQKLFLSLDDARREAVEQEAARRCREQFGGDFPSFAVAGAITNIMAELQAA